MPTYHRKAERRRPLSHSTDMLAASQTLTNSFINQFAPSTFDSHSFGPMNDTNQTSNIDKSSFIANNISQQEGWTRYCDLDSLNAQTKPGYCLKSEQGRYIQEPNNRTVLSNDVMPNFSTKYGYGSNDLYNSGAMSYKNELFTGNLSSHIPKEETRPLFQPRQSRCDEVGLPYLTDQTRDRISVGNYQQGVSPFEAKREAPSNSMYRAMPKSLEEMYVDPVTVLEGRYVQSGMRGTKRSKQPSEVISYVPDQFKTMGEDDMLPDRGRSYAPKIRDNFVMKVPHKDSQHVEYTGAAFNREHTADMNVPQEMRGLHAESTKQNFRYQDPLHKFAHQETTYNPNHDAYYIDPTTKETTIDNNRSGSAYHTNSTYAHNPNQPLPTTLKEQIGALDHHILAPNTMRGTAHSYTLIEPTLKEGLINNDPHHNLGTQSYGIRTYQTEAAKPTMKEGLIESLGPANVYQSNTTYVNSFKNPDSTLKEQLIDVDWNRYPQILDSHFTASTIHHDKPIDTTLKEQLIDIPFNQIISPHNTASTCRNNRPVSTTLKEQIIENDLPKTVSNIYERSTTRNQSPLQTTLKEQIVTTPISKIISTINAKIKAYNKTPVSTTLKEQTLSNHTPTNIYGEGNRLHQRDPTRTTIKEQTVDIPRPMLITTKNGGGAADMFNRTLLDTTLKEQTYDNDRPGAVNLDIYGKGYGYLAEHHYAPETNRESTCQETLNGPLIADQEKQRHNDAELSTRFRSIREQLQNYREPTPQGTKVTVGPDSVLNAVLRDDNNLSRDPILGYSFNPYQDRLVSSHTSNHKSSSDINRFINPNLVSQLESNPTHIKYCIG